MNVDMATEWVVTWPQLVAFALAMITIIWTAATSYRSIMSRFDHMEERMTAMEARNVVADQATTVVKEEQANQRTTIAVMAEQMHGMARTMDRIDRNVSELVKGTHDAKSV